MSREQLPLDWFDTLLDTLDYQLLDRNTTDLITRDQRDAVRVAFDTLYSEVALTQPNDLILGTCCNPLHFTLTTPYKHKSMPPGANGGCHIVNNYQRKLRAFYEQIDRQRIAFRAAYYAVIGEDTLGEGLLYF
jgi:hypothetical protein